MKKFVCVMLMALFFVNSAYAFNFPDPDWGALYYERKAMDEESMLDLYVESPPDHAPYYYARLEPRAGTYIGMAADAASQFKPLGSYLTYIESYTQSDLYNPSNYMIKQDNVTAMIGWNVNSVDNVNYDNVRKVLDMLASYNKPMFIRFACEMNCSNLGDEPAAYIQAFRNVADMVHEYPNFAIVWNPNDLGALNRPFEYYYPGDDFVDWVGVSCYMPKYFTNEVNTSYKNSVYFMTGDYAWATNKIKPIMKFMRENNINKPMMVSEGGVARYNSFGDDYTGWHEPRLRNMLWYLVMKYPQIKMINYFNVNFNNYGEHYYISDYPESVNIFNEAAGCGVYLRSADDSPEFVFSPANEGGTLPSKDGLVNLYTLAYFANTQNISVNYKIDGVWYHAANEIPYICRLDVNSITDGMHTLTIEANGSSKAYKLYKKGQYIRFGAEPDIIVSEYTETSAAENTPAVSEQPIFVNVNGHTVVFDQSPILESGRTLVPMRAIFEALGASVVWNDAVQTATAQKNNITVSVQIGNTQMLVNQIAKTLDVPAKLLNNRTLVPVRAVSEAFGCDVTWNDETQTITITE